MSREAEELIGATDIISVIGAYVDLKKQGATWKGLCPFHDEKHPSFDVDPRKQIYKCFGCGAGGDSIDFLMRWGRSFSEAMEELKSGSKTNYSVYQKKAALEPQIEWMQINPSRKPDEVTHYLHGAPAKTYTWHSPNGKFLGYTCRFNLTNGKKVVLPYCYATDGNRTEWRWMGFNKPRIVYNAHLFLKHPEAKNVIIVEGEKAADAVNKALSGTKSFAITWMGGAHGIKYVDWSILKNKNIYLWPDNDYSHEYGDSHEKAGQVKPWYEQPGNHAMLEIYRLLPKDVMQVKWVTPPTNTPCGWDAADKEWAPKEIGTFIKSHSGPVPKIDELPNEDSKENENSITSQSEDFIIRIMVNYPNIRTQILSSLSSKMFFDKKCGIVFDLIKSLHNKSEVVDYITINLELRKKNLDFTSKIDLWTKNIEIDNIVEIRSLCNYIRNRYFSQNVVASIEKITKECEGQDVVDLIKIARELKDVSTIALKGVTTKESIALSQQIDKVLEDLEKHRHDKTKNYLTTGFNSVDKKFKFIKPGRLIYLAGRPGMGKTSFVLAIAAYVAFSLKRKVKFYSIEMSAAQLVIRLLAMLTGIDSTRIEESMYDDDEYNIIVKAKSMINDYIIIDDRGDLTIDQYEADVINSIETDDIALIIGDYLQILGYDFPKSKDPLDDVSKALKRIAKETQIPAIWLSQMSRAVESRDQGFNQYRPKMSDLRGTGALEQDADTIIFLFRPEYYNLKEDSDGKSMLGLAEVIVEKNRSGAVGSAWLSWKSHLTKFEDLPDNNTITNLKEDDF